MRKLALIALASLPLLGGCVSKVCDLPTADFSWTMQDPNGIAWNCTDAAVNYVDVYIGSASPVRFNCTDYGGTIDVSGFTPGSYWTTVEGVGAGNLIYNRAQFNVAVGDCGGGRYYPVLGEAVLRIDYHFGSTLATDVCYGGGAGYMWFDLRDEVTGQPISKIDTASSTSPPSWRNRYACGSPIEFPVPFGSYTLLGIQEVVSPLTGSATSVAESCSPAGPVVVDHLGVGTVTNLTPPDLAPPAAGAPACYPGAAP
jgi:hypothetical protein